MASAQRDVLVEASEADRSFMQGGKRLDALALPLWGSRLIEAPWRICGHETLGMDVCVDINSPYYGRIPVTPIMDFQIDNIAIHYLLMPWKAKLLKELQKKILANRKEDWLEIHLTMFVLLNNVERQVRHDNWFARRYGMKVEFPYARSLDLCPLQCTDVAIESILELPSYRRNFLWGKDSTGTFPSCQ